ncbi:MAG: DUF4189 domain-containing protein [Ignavibacteria bacterium]|nr:DUF4189 domain-containing protein [Ignavibacteria bacterium]
MKINACFSFVLIFFFATIVSAQSAVYFCKSTGAFGYAYGQTTVAEAENKAYNACKEYGGTNIIKVASTDRTGWGVIAVGYNDNGNRSIGVALGYDDMEEAKAAAKKYCADNGGKDITYYDFWDDYIDY